MNYKDTLNLPKTEFPMRADLAHLEPRMLKLWQDTDVYIKSLQDKEKKYTLHDGPPYANGRIHIGHALNKILKDVVIKYKTLRGYHCKMIPGWDCHGLPVELALLKEQNARKDSVDQIKFREQAAEYALKHVEMQKEDFRALGCWGHWDEPYLTLNPSYEAGMLEVLADLCSNGYIYRGLRPVNWCVDCSTALAEAEVEYADKESDSIYFRFKLLDTRGLGVDSADVVVWTTTPWTLLSNVAVAFNPELDYVLAETDRGNLIFAESSVEFLKNKFLRKAEIKKRFKASELEKRQLVHPFLARKSMLVLADYVSASDGSGCVHIAPGHGADDFAVGRKYDLDVIMPINDKGVFEGVDGVFEGVHLNKMNPLVIDVMTENGSLLMAEKIRHSYPHCWRCRKPLMFRATEQWFLNVSHNGLREKILEHVDKNVEWVPGAGQERFRSMIVTRPDWCLSRQRLWGVPIPSLKCNICGRVELYPEFVTYLAGIVREKGSNVYFKKNISELLPEGFKCSCGKSDFEKGTDILDVWFESGVSFYSVLGQNAGVEYPSDLYLEGSDQHRGWFQVSMINSVAVNGRAPYRSVLTHGFVVDGSGRKMSKSVGNVVAPQEVMKKYGAEILRLWTIFSDYRDEVRISDEILKQLADAYRKIRNTIRFLLGNIDGFDVRTMAVEVDQMRPIERYMLSKLAELSEKTTANYDGFLFYKIYHDIYDFCNVTLSSFYLDMMKDKLYTYSPKSKERLASQTVLWHCADFLIKAVSPFLSFTAEQAYREFSAENKKESVFLDEWSDYSCFRDTAVEKEIEKLLALRDKVFKALEEKRVAGMIGSALEAKVKLTFKDKEQAGYYAEAEDELREIFIVSAVEVMCGDVDRVEIASADGSKCPRCWNVREDIGADDKYSEVCSRCAQALADSQLAAEA